MAKKYVKDYRLKDSIDANGRIHSEAEYVGGSFYRCTDADTAKRKSVFLACICAFGWLAWLLPLLFNNGAMHLFYLSYPFIFCALTLFLLSMAAYTALTAPDPMKHKPSDRLNKWIPGTALTTAILAGVVLAGLALTVIFRFDVRLGHTLNAYDILFAVCAAAVCAAGITAYTQRKFFRTEER